MTFKLIKAIPLVSLYFFKNPGMERNFQKYDAKAVQLLGTPYDLSNELT